LGYRSFVLAREGARKRDEGKVVESPGNVQVQSLSRTEKVDRAIKGGTPVRGPRMAKQEKLHRKIVRDETTEKNDLIGSRCR